MENLGNLAKVAAETARERAGEHSPSKALAQPVSSTASAPALVNQTADYELPKLLTGYRPDNAPWELWRPLSETERGLVELRVNELRRALTGWLPTERDAVNATLGAMFGGFRSMRQQGDDVRGIALVTASVLRDFPLWAIAKGCRKIASREAGLNPSFPPNDAEIFGVVTEIVQGYRKTLALADALLAATVRPPRALPKPPPATGYDGPPVGAEPYAPREELNRRAPDGDHAARVAADLAARRANHQGDAA